MACVVLDPSFAFPPLTTGHGTKTESLASSQGKALQLQSLERIFFLSRSHSSIAQHQRREEAGGCNGIARGCCWTFDPGGSQMVCLSLEHTSLKFLCPGETCSLSSCLLSTSLPQVIGYPSLYCLHYTTQYSMMAVSVESLLSAT